MKIKKEINLKNEKHFDGRVEETQKNTAFLLLRIYIAKEKKKSAQTHTKKNEEKKLNDSEKEK